MIRDLQRRFIDWWCRHASPADWPPPPGPRVPRPPTRTTRRIDHVGPKRRSSYGRNHGWVMVDATPPPVAARPPDPPFPPGESEPAY